jgi:hypothetical protein
VHEYFTDTGLSPPMVELSRTILLIIHTRQSVLQPPRINTEVWALPRSLATTYGIIIIFSSSPYLDVSVQEV